MRTCLTHFDQIELAFSVGSNVVKNEAEDIVLDEEGVAQGLQHKVLHEGLGRIVVSLESINHKSVFPWYGLAIGDKRDKTRGRVGFWF